MPDNGGMEKDVSIILSLRHVTGRERYAHMEKEYLGGLTARCVAERHGVNPSTFQSHLTRNKISKGRAAEEKWRVVQPALAPVADPERLGDDGGQPSGPPSPDDQPMDPREATRQALVHAARLLAQGKLGEAIEVAKLAETMSRAVDRLGLGEPQAPEVDEEASWAAVRERVMALAAEG